MIDAPLDAPNASPSLPACDVAKITAKPQLIGGKLYTHPEILRVFRDGIQPAMRMRGYDCAITSGSRTLNEQLADYQAYRAGKGGRAAPPGRSAHNYGLAIDVLVRPVGFTGDAWAWASTRAGHEGYQVLHQVARHYGLEDISAVAPDDPFHLQAPNWRRLVGL